MLLGRIVHQNIKLAEFLDRLPNRLATERLVADVTLNSQCLPVLSLDELYRIIRIPSFLKVYEGNVCTFPRHRDRSRAPDATVTAGNERDLAFQSAASPKERHVFGSRMHQVFAPGLVTLGLRRDVQRHGNRVLAEKLK